MNKPHIEVRTFNFSLDLLKLVSELKKKKHYEVASQVLRSGTSIGANVQEARAGESYKDFIHKISIARKEAKETHYWLRLIREAGYLNEESINDLIREADEICRILTATVKTSKNRLK